jgi:hypothetical protein
MIKLEVLKKRQYYISKGESKMRWLLLVGFLFCFSALAEVVCRAPGGGDDATSATSATSTCNPSATGGDAVDRDVNHQAVVQNTAGTVASEEGDSPTGTSEAQQ